MSARGNPRYPRALRLLTSGRSGRIATLALLTLYPLGQSISGALSTVQSIGNTTAARVPWWFHWYTLAHGAAVFVASLTISVSVLAATPESDSAQLASGSWRTRLGKWLRTSRSPCSRRELHRLRVRTWFAVVVPGTAFTLFCFEYLAGRSPPGIGKTLLDLLQTATVIVALLGIAAYADYARREPADTPQGMRLDTLWRASRALRLEVITVGIFTAILVKAPVTPEQTQDAIREWASAAWSVPLFAFAAAILFSLVLHESSILMVHPQSHRPVPRIPRTEGATVWAQRHLHTQRSSLERTVIAVGIAVAISGIAAGGYRFTSIHRYVSAWGVAAIAMWLILYLAVLPHLHTEKTEPSAVLVPFRLYRALAVAPLVVLLGSILRALGDYFLLGAPHTSFARLALFVVLFSLAVLVIGEWGTLRRLDDARDDAPDFTNDLVIDDPDKLRDPGKPPRKIVALEDRSWIFSTLALTAVAGCALFAAVAARHHSIGGLTSEDALAGLSSLGLAGYAVGRKRWVIREGSHRPLESCLCYGLGLPLARACGIVLLVGICIMPHDVGDMIGTVGLVLFAFAAGLSALHLVMRTFWSNIVVAPAWIARCVPRHVPALSLIVVWCVVAFIAAPTNAHPVRQVPASSIADQPPTLNTAFKTWTGAQPELQKGFNDRSGPVPLILIAAHGGGVRATYWTDLVLDCLIAHDKPAGCGPQTDEAEAVDRRSRQGEASIARRVFLASGVSGGGVGLSQYSAQLVTASDLTPGWVERRAGRDFVSAAAGYGLFHDLPAFLIGLHSSDAEDTCDAKEDGIPSIDHPCLLLRDRAAVLEEEFDDSNPPPPHPRPLLRTIWQARGTPPERAPADLVPLVITNATIDGATDRLLVSPANLANPERRDAPDTETARKTDSCPPQPRLADAAGAIPAARDLTDVMDGNSTDIRMITAGLLAARFPIISTSGRLASRNCAASAADGGYLDNSGLLTISAILPALKQMVAKWNTSHAGPDIQIVLLDVDDHFDSKFEPAATHKGGPPRVDAPVVANLMGRGDYIERLGRDAAYALLPAECELSIRPRAHVGASAPLGWTLSDATKQDMQRALNDLPRLGKAFSLVSQGCPDRNALRFIMVWKDGTGRNAPTTRGRLSIETPTGDTIDGAVPGPTSDGGRLASFKADCTGKGERDIYWPPVPTGQPAKGAYFVTIDKQPGACSRVSNSAKMNYKLIVLTPNDPAGSTLAVVRQGILRDVPKTYKCTYVRRTSTKRKAVYCTTMPLPQ